MENWKEEFIKVIDNLKIGEKINVIYTDEENENPIESVGGLTLQDFFDNRTFIFAPWGCNTVSCFNSFDYKDSKDLAEQIIDEWGIKEIFEFEEIEE